MRPSSTSAAVALVAALALMAVPAAADPAGPTPDPASPSATAVPTEATPSQAATAAAVASLSVASATTEDGHIQIRATADAQAVRVRFRTAAAEEAVVTEEVRDGQAAFTLEPGSTSIEVRARATQELAASPWVTVTDAPEPVPGPGVTHTVSPTSPILGKLAGRKTVNKHTRAYYLIRSYMEAFEDAGGGTLMLGPGRYVISSTIYVPSNTTIQLSEGTTLVKGDRTGTKKFSASNSMFMLIQPALGKKEHAVGGHDGAANITIAGAGAGRSVIDLDNIRGSLAIIAGHNRGVTISGITFRQLNNNHFIEMDGCADCAITGNEFLDAATGSRRTAEAINLDTPDPRTGGFGSIWSKQDETPNERVTISANRFDGMPRALGTHNFSA
ncbi:MAG TPA: hypothetical protein VLQ92_09790, partial [Candidatus Limnocylindrales bacterium]|nr:hypothetical protein [Candidatus Limnocylindrales bacterium]